MSMLSPGLKRAAAVLADLLGLLMSAVLAWYGYLVAYDAWDFGDLSTTSLRFPGLDLLRGPAGRRRADGAPLRHQGVPRPPRRGRGAARMRGGVRAERGP